MVRAFGAHGHKPDFPHTLVLDREFWIEKAPLTIDYCRVLPCEHTISVSDAVCLQANHRGDFR